MQIPLTSPLKCDGQTIDKLELNLNGLKGVQIIEAEREARMRGDSSPNPLYSSQGLAILAAKASGQKADDILDLSAPDFIMVTTMVSNFLYGWVLPTIVQSGTSDEQS